MKWIVKKASPDDRPWILEVVRGWGADFVVTRGRKVYPVDLEAYIAFNGNGDRLGLITFEMTGDQCEIVTLDALTPRHGIGSVLMEELIKDVRARGSRRVWLITTNDNLDALRFYQRRGFVIAAVHRGAIAESRRLKPSIPLEGNYGIPIRDEIELELRFR